MAPPHVGKPLVVFLNGRDTMQHKVCWEITSSSASGSPLVGRYVSVMASRLELRASSTVMQWVSAPLLALRTEIYQHFEE